MEWNSFRQNATHVLPHSAKKKLPTGISHFLPQKHQVSKAHVSHCNAAIDTFFKHLEVILQAAKLTPLLPSTAVLH